MPQYSLPGCAFDSFPEVNIMDEHTESPIPEEGYTPRPAWQVWAARVGVVVMILFVIWQILQIAGGGL